jgi:hypothetical protein
MKLCWACQAIGVWRAVGSAKAPGERLVDGRQGHRDQRREKAQTPSAKSETESLDFLNSNSRDAVSEIGAVTHACFMLTFGESVCVELFEARSAVLARFCNRAFLFPWQCVRRADQRDDGGDDGLRQIAPSIHHRDKFWRLVVIGDTVRRFRLALLNCARR